MGRIRWNNVRLNVWINAWRMKRCSTRLKSHHWTTNRSIQNLLLLLLMMINGRCCRWDRRWLEMMYGRSIWSRGRRAHDPFDPWIKTESSTVSESTLAASTRRQNLSCYRYHTTLLYEIFNVVNHSNLNAIGYVFRVSHVKLNRFFTLTSLYYI